MNFSQYRFLERVDLHRLAGNSTLSIFFRRMVVSPGYKYTFWMRTRAYLKSHPLFRFVLLPPAWLILSHYEHKYGVSISYQTQVDSGLHIGHFGGIVVNRYAVIRKNCNLSHQVTLGVVRRGSRTGSPVIGDNVYIGPEAKVIGNVHVGNSVAIGADCVVIEDVPDNSVVVEVPGKVVSSEGSTGHINRTDYD